MTTTTEAVLSSLENSATTKVRVLFLDRKGNHGIDHVLELVRARHLAFLVHLTDDNGIDELLFTVVSDEC